jgi:hypothetical protein
LSPQFYTSSLLLTSFYPIFAKVQSNVGAIKLTVTSTSGHDITIANFKTGVTTPPTAVKGLALRATGTSFPLLAGLLGTTAVVVSTRRKRQD